MIVRVKPKIDVKLKNLYEKFINAKNKTLPLHQKFLKSMNEIEIDLFMQYVSYKYEYNLKDYEKQKKIFKHNHRKFIDIITDIIISLKDSETWKLDQKKLIKGVELGAMYQMQYRKYKHDPYPLVIFLNDYDEKHNNFMAINLHYLTKPVREFLVKKLLEINRIRISKGFNIIITYDMIKKIINVPEIIFRNYKAEHIKLIEYIEVSKWTKYLMIDNRKVII